MSDPFLGEIRMVGFNYAPQGWAFCNGQILSIAQNSALFALLGTTFGGDGITTFGLPDYRGRGPVGMGSGPNLTPVNQGDSKGAESTTILSNQMPVHTHATTTGTSTFQVGSTASNPVNVPSATNSVLSASGAGQGNATIWSDTLTGPVTITNPQSVTVTVEPAGGSQPLPIRNPYLGTNFIIALNGIFPSHS